MTPRPTAMPRLILWRDYCQAQLTRTNHPYWRQQLADALLQLEGL